MKKMIFLLMTIFTISINISVNAKEVGVTCWTKSFPTTSVNLFKNSNNKFQLNVTHHNGVKFAPIHKGVITSHDLKHLKKKSEVFTSLGDRYSVQFEFNNCEQKDGYLSCYTRDQDNLNNKGLRNYSFRLYRETVLSNGYEFNHWSAHFDVMINGDNLVYNSVMQYQQDDCHF